MGTAAAPPVRAARIRAFAWWPLVCVQVAAALLLAGWASDSALGRAVAVPAAVLLVSAAVLRYGGRSLPARLEAARALRRRRSRAAGPPAPGSDPLLAFASECAPGLRSYSFAGRERRDVGMAGDGSTLTAVVRVESVGRPLPPGPGAGSLPLRLLREALDTDGIRLESVQAVQHTRPGSPSAGGGGPVLRLTWVALRLDPELCVAAVRARGGGLEGAQRCLTRAADQLASRLNGAGFSASVLSETELLSAVAACAGSDPAITTLVGRGNGPRSRRTAESARSWRCDDRLHTVYRITRWPALGGGARPLHSLIALLTAPPAFAVTFSLTLRRAGRGSVALDGRVRVTGLGEPELRTARKALVRAARTAGLGLSPMDREQLTGVLTTLPLGGVR
ncbi:type VII secretion protein EccE [Streptomyces sp. ACA25]|uniref:type VII secretion protein EccE n=1 Tax=Streptomyces sp. ACA25 TaxID=3022596 RepID=UPI002306F0BE|nr:type VII secretion protein EccE [Streptomyces sp. ACA25]MDB1089717.1 type VII secretion protein EccE [Streptomyces sp. ACA25]